MREFPDRFLVKHRRRRPADDSNSAAFPVDMPGNAEHAPGNSRWTGPGVPLGVPPLVVIDPPEEPVTLAFLLVTAALWAYAAWRRPRTGG